MIFLPFLVVCCLFYGLVNAETTGTLLDDSEYQKLLSFDEMLQSLIANALNQTDLPKRSGKASVVSLTLNYANIAMMYHQRSQRWKQGGTAESLRYVDLALQAQLIEADHAHGDEKLRRSMLLHKASMLTSLGQRASSLAILDSLIRMRNATGLSTVQHHTMSNQELSSVLYHKAELLLTLYDDFSGAVELFRQALELHPCHYLAHLQLVHAMKATKSVTREEWLSTIASIEQYLSNIKQKPVNTKSKFKYKPPHIEYHAPVDTSMTIVNDTETSVLHRMYNTAYSSVYSILYPTPAVCTYTSESDSDLYATTGSMRTSTVTLSGIHASVSWALFVAADSVQMTGDKTVDNHTLNTAWKYLQQARHFDRQRINEQHQYMAYQQLQQQGQQGSQYLPEGVEVGDIFTSDDDFVGSEGSGDSSGEVYTLEEQAVRKMTEHSAKQANHLVTFFQKGYWGNTEHYKHYTTPTTTSVPSATQATPTSTTKQSTPATSIHPSGETGSKTRIPIFVVGFFRSGSTLLETLLETHGGFRVFADDSSEDCTGGNGGTSSEDRTAQAAALGFTRRAIWGMGEDSPFVFEMYAMQEETLQAHDRLEKKKAKVQAKYPSDEAKRLRAENKLDEGFMKEYSGIIDKKATVIVDKLLQRYQDMNPTTSNTTSSTTPLHIIDKMLANYVNIGLIHLVFPRAIVLHPVRDPLDTLFSCYSNRFGDPSAVYTLHTDMLVQKYVQYLQVMQHFRSVLPYYTLPRWNITTTSTAETVRSANSISVVGPQLIEPTKSNKPVKTQALIDVRYEELVANPERILRFILNDVLGVEYVSGSGSDSNSSTENIVDNVVGVSGESTSTSTTTAHTTTAHTTTAHTTTAHTTTNASHARVVHTASRLQVKQPIYTSSVGKWRKYPQLRHSLLPALQAHLPYLASVRALPFLDPNSTVVQNLTNEVREVYTKVASKCKNLYWKQGNKKRECVYMNWDLRDDFDYTYMLERLA